MTGKSKICFIGYGKLSEMIREVLKESAFDDVEVSLIDCSFDTLKENVTKAIHVGYDVFIAGSANAAEYQRHFRAPLIEITVNSFDYAVAVKKSLQIGKRPVVATYKFSQIPNLNAIEDLTGVKIERIVYEDTLELVEQLRNSKADVVIGASLVNEIAETLFKKSVLLYPGSESILMALKRACSTARNLRRWQRSQGIYNTILDNCYEGVIGIDEQENIVFYNRAAELLTGVPSYQAKREKVREVFPGFILPDLIHNNSLGGNKSSRLNGRSLLTSLRRVEASGNVLGAVAIVNKKSKTHSNDGPLNIERNNASFEYLLATSPSLHGIVDELKTVIKSGVPVVITGEPGVGKTYMAHAVHNSLCTEKPLSFVNFASIPKNHVTQYLFGREGKSGEIISCGVFSNAGTIVFKRLHQLDATLQDLLSDALKNNSYDRVSGRNGIPINSNILVIVESDEWDKIKTISKGLYYCLTPYVINIPPLRERQTDITRIFSSISNKMLTFADKRYKISPLISSILEAYSWPGNILEMNNVARRFSTYVSREKISTEPVQRNALIAAIGEEELFNDILRNFGDIRLIADSPDLILKAVSKLKETLSLSNATIAEKLGISRTTMWRALSTAEPRNMSSTGEQ